MEWNSNFETFSTNFFTPFHFAVPCKLSGPLWLLVGP